MTLYENPFYQEDLKVTIENISAVEALFGKKILITGSAGLIGSSLVDVLLKMNESGARIEIYALGRNLIKLEERFPHTTEALHFVVQDLNEDLSFDFQVDMVIHAASNANPISYSEDPIGTIQGNTEATMKLLDYCREAAVEQFLYISSGEVYGQLDERQIPFTEEMSGYIDPMAVRSCYMLSKKMAENICISYQHQYGIKTKVIRLSHVFGPAYTSKDNRVSAAFVNDALAGKDIVLKSLGNQLRSYVYIADAVSGILSVLTAGESGQAYNVTNTDNAVMLVDFAKTLADLAGVKQVIELEDSNQQDMSKITPISFAVLSDEKLRKATGWKPVFTVERGLKEMLSILNN